MLDTTQEGSEETQQFPLQMCPHSAGHHQPEAVGGGAHLIYNGERAMGRCRDHTDRAGEKTSRIAWTPGEDRSSSPQDMPVWMVIPNTTMRRSNKEVERPGEERSAGSRDM